MEMLYVGSKKPQAQNVTASEENCPFVSSKPDKFSCNNLGEVDGLYANEERIS